MIISSTWQNISSVACLVTKHGTSVLSLSYSLASPVGGDSFGVGHNIVQSFPLVPGKSLWARTTSGDVSITVVEV